MVQLDKQRVSLTAVFLLFILLSGCPSGELGFKSTDQELMREFQAALNDANITFREDHEGLIRYRHEDAVAANEILERLEKELHSGITVKYDDQEATQYLREMLTSLGMKYRVERKPDGEWTRWYPKSSDQNRDISRKVIEHVFELKKKRLAGKCPANTEFIDTSLDGVHRENTPRVC
ncbi:MAG: hypothetical protein OEY86_12035 [Nitrospira sp.]|nr:hypothetical protein [Nitrospira sp.]